MPKAKMAGINLQPVDSVRNKITPTAIHMTATTAKNPALEGRRPMVTGVSGFKGRRPGRLPPGRPGLAGLAFIGLGAPPFGVTRPVDPGLRWREAMK
jgi:hypothetical protein